MEKEKQFEEDVKEATEGMARKIVKTMESNRFEKIVDMLHEFDYHKNSKLDTINFLSYCINVIAQILEEGAKESE